MAVEEIPDWLTANFLKTCLESNKENFPDTGTFTITNHVVELVRKTREDFIKMQVKIVYKKQDNTDCSEKFVSLVVEAPLTGGWSDHFLNNVSDSFMTETVFYNEYIKETYKLKKHNIVPKHYSSPKPHCLVLEDLKESGYITFDRLKLLDLEHCQLYIKASAKLQALSIAVNKKKPELIQKILQPEKSKTLDSIYGLICVESLGLMAEFIKNNPSFKKQFDVISELVSSEKVPIMFLEMEESDLPLKALILTEPLLGGNKAFKYDSSGKVQDIKLLDFSLIRFGCPVFEFIKFLWCRVDPEVRETRINYLYYLYCDSLNTSLEELGCPERLPFDVFKQEVVRLSPLALMVLASTTAVLSTLEKMGFDLFKCAESDSFEEHFLSRLIHWNSDESSFEKSLNSSNVDKYCLQSLKQMEREGIFDYLKKKIN